MLWIGLGMLRHFTFLFLFLPEGVCEKIFWVSLDMTYKGNIFLVCVNYSYPKDGPTPFHLFCLLNTVTWFIWALTEVQVRFSEGERTTTNSIHRPSNRAVSSGWYTAGGIKYFRRSKEC